MIATIRRQKETFDIDLSKPIDLSIPLRGTLKNPSAWYQGPPVFEPVRDGNWIGKVSEGGVVNFNNIIFNPHAHGTHTECVGHITHEFHSVERSLNRYFFLAEVITVAPESKGDDMIISAKQLRTALKGKAPEAVVIRTLPNTTAKRSQQHSNTNWPYLEARAARLLRESGVSHLLIDQPSVDREVDAGKLSAHKEFWNYPDDIRKDATITEFIYVANKVKDGSYLLNLQTAPFHNDATPSRPILYKIITHDKSD